MKTTANYGIRVLAIGFMVLVFFAIPLYWGRFFSELLLCARMPQEATRVEFSPSRILPETVENDPNVDRHSRAGARMEEERLVQTLGFVDCFLSRTPGGDRSDVFYYSRAGAWMYFDRSAGQIVFRDVYREQREGRADVERQTESYYAGPDGISKSPDQTLGRFRDPTLVPAGAGRHIIYDRKLHRFFAIDREALSVKAGPELTDAVLRSPVVIGPDGYDGGIQVYWQAPSERVLREAQDEDSPPRYEQRFTIRFDSGGYWSPYIPVIDASGRIDLLDQQTLELITGKGMLPAPKTLYGEGPRRPSQLLRYQVRAISTGSEHEYTGLVASSISRQGTSLAMSIFDKDGRLIQSVDTRALPYSEKARILDNASSMADSDVRNLMLRQSPWLGSARAALFEVPWSPALTAFKYVLENVHPPVLTAVSFFLANGIEAGASHRTLFLVPNSFAAMHRDQTRQSIVAQFFGALWVMLPAIGLSVFLAWRVVRDGAAVGLSSNARSLWLLGTLAFGLPAYITYRMTRPTGTLVTCATCGRTRRSDMERCHLCNGAWEVPELIPPAWRVLDGGPESSEPPAGSEKSSDVEEQKTDSSVESM